MTALRAAVVDYGAGNMVSITHALERAGASVCVARRPSDLDGAGLVVVPGVGASGPAMERLRRRGLDTAIRAHVEDGGWLLGVCLGLQLLFERSDEDGAEGFGLLPGDVRRLVGAPRLPHIGWNTVHPVRPHPVLAGIEPGAPFYFVHSFVAVPREPELVLATTEHGPGFASVVGRGRVLGVQFHPERSGADGTRLLANAVALAASQRANAA